MDWRVADLNLPDIPTPALETTARQACARMVRCVSLKQPKDASRVSFMETHVGCATVLIVQHLTRPEGEKPLLDCHSYQRCVSILRSTVKLALYRPVQASNTPLIPYDGCEVLYGRAGLLYALIFLRSKITAEVYSDVPITGDIKSLISFNTLRKVVDDVIERGRMGTEATRPPGVAPSAWPPLMWSWHHKLYLGAAHGVGKSIFLIALSLTLSSRQQSEYSKLSSRVHWTRSPCTSPSSYKPWNGCCVYSARTAIGHRKRATDPRLRNRSYSSESLIFYT